MGAAEEQTGDYPMATIGTFTKSEDGSLTGAIKTLTLNVKAAQFELATIGNEGMVGISAVLNARRMAHRTFVQVPGEGDCMEVGPFVALLPQMPNLQKLLLRYAMALMTQIAQGSACGVTP
jgi:hypothetical protein